MNFELSQHSLAHLAGVHPDLVKVVRAAIAQTPVDFAVVQGLRHACEERELVAKGASTTMHSRHLAAKSGYACAVDLAAVVDGAIAWQPIDLYYRIADAMKAAAQSLGIPIEWGGDWLHFHDYGHFQLPWATYP